MFTKQFATTTLHVKLTPGMLAKYVGVHIAFGALTGVLFFCAPM